MKVGDTAQIERRFSSADVADYVALGGAPAARDELPEPLVGALFSYLLGTRLPGRGTNYLKQETALLHPVRIGERLRASVTVTRLRPDKQLVDLETLCFNEADALICRGRALVLAADLPTD